MKYPKIECAHCDKVVNELCFKELGSLKILWEKIKDSNLWQYFAMVRFRIHFLNKIQLYTLSMHNCTSLNMQIINVMKRIEVRPYVRGTTT